MRKLADKISDYLSLCRIPNILTIPGDVMIGFLIAESTFMDNGFLLGYYFPTAEFVTYSFIYTLIAIASIYLFGLVMNDIMDYKEDKIERPTRPLPSGAISLFSARVLAAFFAISGIVFANFANRSVFFIILILLLVVILYNTLLKKNRYAGAVALALCRTFAILAGFFAVGLNQVYKPIILYVVVLIWIMYFLGLSMIAFGEVEEKSKSKKECFLFYLHYQYGYWLLLFHLIWEVIYLFFRRFRWHINYFFLQL